MSRFYNPVPAGSGQFCNHYGVRGQGGHQHRIMGANMRLSWDQADRLCDLLEEIREYALHEFADAD